MQIYTTSVYIDQYHQYVYITSDADSSISLQNALQHPRTPPAPGSTLRRALQRPVGASPRAAPAHRQQKLHRNSRGAEVTESSTNKQHHLSPPAADPSRQLPRSTRCAITPQSDRHSQDNSRHPRRTNRRHITWTHHSDPLAITLLPTLSFSLPRPSFSLPTHCLSLPIHPLSITLLMMNGFYSQNGNQNGARPS
jgi:hypothetical protein